MFLDCRRMQENQHRTHTDAGITRKLHTERSRPANHNEAVLAAKNEKQLEILSLIKTVTYKKVGKKLTVWQMILITA